MARGDWFRNKIWSPEIKAAFFQRLRRARDKSQYLRIQASCLSEKHPHAALQLLEEYFSLGEHFDRAQAHVDRARAYIALEDVESAIASYEDALERERFFPRLRTQAYLDLVFLVAMSRKFPLYPRVLEVLDSHRDYLLFPADRYRAHGARALILQELGQTAEARSSAELALAAAAETRSGFRYHQGVGVVGNTDDEFGNRINAAVC